MDDREMKKLGIVLGLGLLGFLILSQAYQAGVSTGLSRGGDGRVIDSHGEFGFFPFPPFLLLVGGAILFVVWRRRAGNGPGGPGRGPGGGRPPRFLEDWHRQMHETEAAPPTVSAPVNDGEAQASGSPGFNPAGGNATGSGPAAGGMV